MSDVKVTREHRLAGYLAAYSADESEATGHDLEWVERGESDAFPLASDVAQAIAKAEHNLRAAVIADLRGLVERASPAWLDGPDLVSADSLELLIETLEAQQS
jgi:hypothetical protein